MGFQRPGCPPLIKSGRHDQLAVLPARLARQANQLTPPNPQGAPALDSEWGNSDMEDPGQHHPDQDTEENVMEVTDFQSNMEDPTNV